MSRYRPEQYEGDKSNREAWNALAPEGAHLPIISYEEWVDESLWAEALRTRPFLSFDDWKAEQAS